MMESSGETGSGRKQVRTLDSWAGAGRPRPMPPTQARPTPPGLADGPSSGLGLIPGQGSQGPQGDYAPSLSLDGPTAFLTAWPGETPSNGPEPGKTDRCDKDGRSGWREGHLTYQVALQEGCGRRGGETEKECVKDSRMDRATPGEGWGACACGACLRLPDGPGLGCREAPSVPPNRVEGLVSRMGPLCPG